MFRVLINKDYYYYYCYKASKCQSKNRCTNCNRKHHTSICNKENQSSASKEQTTRNEDIQQKQETTHATLTPTTQMSYMGPSSHQTSLLKTAVATVRSNSSAIETNILFDEGPNVPLCRSPLH